MKKVEEYIRNIPDFPEEGIIFRDVTTVLQDAEGLKLAIDSMIRLLDGVDLTWWQEQNREGSFLEFRSLTRLGNRLFRSAKKGNFPVRPYLQNTTWNTAVQRLKCTEIRSFRVKKRYWWMI